jgi:hypothetical protein
MDFNFQIVLFKNKVKKKIINKFKTYKKTNNTFKTLIEESNNVIFPVKYENGNPSNYELAILEKKSNKKEKVFIKDEFGRQIKVDLDDDEFTISKIVSFNVEEEFLDYQTKKKIDSKNFIKKYLSSAGIKMISKLNNKIVVQIDESYNLFTFKNTSDSDRFLDDLGNHLRKTNKNDCILVKDYSTIHRKYLYDILVNQGFPRHYLQRHSTTHPK